MRPEELRIEALAIILSIRIPTKEGELALTWLWASAEKDEYARLELAAGAASEAVLRAAATGRPRRDLSEALRTCLDMMTRGSESFEISIQGPQCLEVG